MRVISDIYLSASFNGKNNSGTYDILVCDIEDNKDVISGRCYAKSVNQVLLKGLIESISRCSNDTNIVVHTNTSIGWNNINKSKLKDMLLEVKNICKLRNINIEIKEKEDLSFLKDLIQAYKF